MEIKTIQMKILVKKYFYYNKRVYLVIMNKMHKVSSKIIIKIINILIMNEILQII